MRRQSTLRTAILSGILFSLPVAAWARPNLSKEQLARLEKGEVIESSEDVNGSDIKRGKAIGLFSDVPEAVLFVLMDVAKYKHFLPRVKESRVTKYRKGNTYAVIETDLPWPFKDCWAYITFKRQDKPGRVFAVQWWMLNGTMEQYSGSALIEPWNKDGTKSVLTYKFLAVPKVTATDASISNALKSASNAIVKRLRNRLIALRKFKKLPPGF